MSSSLTFSRLANKKGIGLKLGPVLIRGRPRPSNSNRVGRSFLSPIDFVGAFPDQGIGLNLGPQKASAFD